MLMTVHMFSTASVEILEGSTIKYENNINDVKLLGSEFLSGDTVFPDTKFFPGNYSYPHPNKIKIT